jgi:hypothetical protein
MVPDASFLSGLRLAEVFYLDVVRPLLDDAFPAVPHSAALLGPGSEVLGYDTERSTDHDWGPRVQIFVRPDDFQHRGRGIWQTLVDRLPPTFAGHPIAVEPLPGDVAEDESRGRGVRVGTVAQFLREHLGFDPRDGMTTTDWLTTPTQRLLEVTTGAVFFDGTEELSPVRNQLHWYPHDIWCYLLACQWGRIGQEEAFVGRAGEVGDELGSRVLAVRLTRDLMRLCFLIERRYAPYAKWLGSAFAQLDCFTVLGPVLSDILEAADWPTREGHLGRAYSIVAERFNELRIAEPIDTTTRSYFNRPFTVLGAGRFVAAARDSIGDEEIRSLPLIGSVDQFIDSTDVLTHPHILRRLAILYGSE